MNRKKPEETDGDATGRTFSGSTGLIPLERIQSLIHTIRNESVMLDSDLADLYGVETRALNQAVQRNKERFPEDFMFKLTKDEFEALESKREAYNLISQTVISS